MDNERDWGEQSVGYDPELLARFEARKTDVFINTAPKAGTTWMQQILHQLRSEEPREFESIYDVVPWIEFPGRTGLTTAERLAKYNTMKAPRVFKAHLPYQRTPGTRVAKFVIVARDPRDRCVSAFHHMNDMTDDFLDWVGAERPKSFDAFFDDWITRPRYNDHVASWWEQRHSANVHWVRYAELKSDFDNTLDGLARFLGWPLSESTRRRVATRSSFVWMSENWDKFARFSAAEEPGWKPKTFVRRGAVGDHKASLRPDQEAQILDQCRAALSPECCAYLGLPT